MTEYRIESAGPCSSGNYFMPIRMRDSSYVSIVGAVEHRDQLRDGGTSGSVQRGPANPARPGREQRYRINQVCRGDSEVPLSLLPIFLPLIITSLSGFEL